MAKSTTKDRIAHDEAIEALVRLESWAINAYEGGKVTVEHGERLARELVEKVKRWREGT